MSFYRARIKLKNVFAAELLIISLKSNNNNKNITKIRILATYVNLYSYYFAHFMKEDKNNCIVELYPDKLI